MPEFEQHGYQGFWLPGRRLSGEHGVVVVIKRRYNVNTVEAVCEPSDETPPVAFMAENYDDADPPNVSARHPSEIAPEKRYVDVMVRGSAYAPGGKPVPEFVVELRIPGVLQRRLRVVGDRKVIWYPPMKELTYKDLAKGETWQWLDPDFSEPAPIDKVPLRYEFAYGGWGKIVLSQDELEMASDAQAAAEVEDKRRERKKEIEAELKAKGAAAAAPKKPEAKPKDEKAQALAAKAFGEGHDGVTSVIDADLIARLNAEAEADDGMKVVSALRLGRDLPDRPEEAPTPARGEAETEGDGEAAEAPAKAADDDPMAAFFTQSEGKTQSIDLAALAASQDELKVLLEGEDARRARELTDEEGVLKNRATEFGDIKLYGDDWAAGYIRERPQKKKQERKASEHPEMPYPANPCGKGFAVSHRREGLDELPLPNIEDPDDPLKPEQFVVELNEQFDLKKLRAPAGWAPYPMSWFPRAQYYGVFPWDVELAAAGKELAKQNYDEEDPDDQKVLKTIDGVEIPIFNMLAYQEAHPKLWVKDLRGDEEVYLTNLTPEGHLFFRLPGLHPTATIDMSQGPIPLTLRLDQLLLDLEDAKKPAVELLWRGWHKIRDYDELGEKPFKRVNIIEVDQVDWLDVKREEAAREAKAPKEGVALLTDADLDKDVEQRYRDQFLRQDDRFGVRKDEVKDAVVFNQTEDRRLHNDAWDDAIRAEKQGFEDGAQAKADAAAKLKEKELKKKAREQADAEFGIIRGDDGEVLVVDESLAEKPPGGAGGAAKGKK